jgi:hypothetical protein
MSAVPLPSLSMLPNTSADTFISSAVSMPSPF